jgi:uncharacterized paraquat-inducible protein A
MWSTSDNNLKVIMMMNQKIEEFGQGNGENCFFCTQCYTIFSPEFNPLFHDFMEFVCPVCETKLHWCAEEGIPNTWLLAVLHECSEFKSAEDDESDIRVEIIEV